MKKQHYHNHHLLAALCISLAAVSVGAAPALGQHQPYFKEGHAPEAFWKAVDSLTDEFDGTEVDSSKWQNDPKDWGVWSWEPENATLKDGILNIQTVYSPHTRDGMELFYTSGVVKSIDKRAFGYFEARIKGASVFPGVCPSFWIKGTDGQESSEVDFIELQEVMKDIHIIDCNLHARRVIDGKLQWVRERRDWTAPWDPRDDYHIYGCHVTPETITWYIDGEKILKAANNHWNIPSNVFVSMGLRPPHRIHVKSEFGEGNETLPNPKAATPDGFPTTMQCDYVRVWEHVE